MADILDYTVTATGGAPAPQFTVAGRVVDSNDQSVELKDLTGTRALKWPAAWTSLTDAQQEQLRQMIARYLVRCAAGLVDPDTGF